MKEYFEVYDDLTGDSVLVLAETLEEAIKETENYDACDFCMEFPYTCKHNGYEANCEKWVNFNKVKK